MRRLLLCRLALSFPVLASYPLERQAHVGRVSIAIPETGIEDASEAHE
jgi:hypothetical protein